MFKKRRVWQERDYLGKSDDLPKVRNKLEEEFDRFTKLNTFARGSGLGLAICRMFGEKMGGCIRGTIRGE